MGVHGSGQREPRTPQHAGPDHTVKPGDIFANHMDRSGPEFRQGVLRVLEYGIRMMRTSQAHGQGGGGGRGT